MILSLIIIGAGFQLADNRSPPVHSATNASSNLVFFSTDSFKNSSPMSLEENLEVCGPVDSCSACLALQERNPPQHCGFCEVIMIIFGAKQYFSKLDGKNKKKGQMHCIVASVSLERRIIRVWYLESRDFLGPRGPLRTPSSVRSFVRPSAPKI